MCHLFHSPYALRHHRPSGFNTCTDTNMAFIDNDVWYMKQRSLGLLNSSFHCMHLDVAFMDRTDSAKEFGHHSVLAQHMKYTKFVSRTLMPNLQRPFEDQRAPLLRDRSIERPIRGLAEADKQGQLIRLEPSKGGTQDANRSIRTRRTISQEHLSQISGETVMVHNASSGDSLVPTQIMEQQDSPTLPTWNWKLRPAKAMEMGVKKDRRLWIPDRDDRQVRCECSSDREELYMLQCVCCNKKQHYTCYGHVLDIILVEHHCYQCLLEDTHKSLLKDMKSIAIFRQALYVLYNKKPSSPADFARVMHLDGKTTQGLIKRLDEGGYLASGRTRLSAVTTPEQLQCMTQLYHNPLTSISGFVSTFIGFCCCCHSKNQGKHLLF
ncbi:hypothetical protein BDR22DRAFT_828377 [Usnea florida]